MNGLLQELLGLAEVEHIRRELESGCPSAVMTGCPLCIGCFCRRR